jgi:RNA polymerase sigma factor (sigma-70 family)
MAIEAGEATPDVDLLIRFASNRDEAAFAELVRRHGPTVFGVCRRTVGHHQDAEDAFQAVFVVLARKAGRIARPELLGNWLYGVAVRVAGKARRRAARRADRERTGAAMPDPPIRLAPPADEFSGVIDVELARLPKHYRDAILLCDVQGVPRPEAAARLGVPDGTLSSRLSNGRKKLAARLTRRGVILPAAGTFLVAVPDGLAKSAVDTALVWSAGAAVPYSILELTRTGGSVMRYAIGAAILTTAGLVAGATAGWPQEKKQDTPKRGEVTANAGEAKAKSNNSPALKVKRLKTIDLDFNATKAFWSSDGRYMIAEGSGRLVSVDTKTFRTREISDSSQTWQVIGFLPGQTAFLAVTPNSSRISAAYQLSIWEWSDKPVHNKDGSWLKANWLQAKTIELDTHPGYWYSILPNGKQFVSISSAVNTRKATDPDPKIANYVFQAHVYDIATGTVVRDFPLPYSYVFNAALSPDGKSLAILTNDNSKAGVVLVNLDDGHSIWKTSVSGEGEIYSPANPRVVFSPDGKKLAVYVLFMPAEVLNSRGGRGGRPGGGPTSGRGSFSPRGLGQPNGPPLQGAGSRSNVAITMFDAGTGKPLPCPYGTNRLIMRAWMGGFSADGKLFGIEVDVYNRDVNTNSSFVEIWDTESGQVVKSWSGSALASFSPVKPLLALLEGYSVGSAVTNTSTRRTSLGFWDCTTPAK